MTTKAYTKYELRAMPCKSCGRPAGFVAELHIPEEASSMMAAVRATVGVGHQESNLPHIDLANNFESIVAELIKDPVKYVSMIKSQGYSHERWYIYGRIVEGMAYFAAECKKLTEAEVHITYPVES